MVAERSRSREGLTRLGGFAVDFDGAEEYEAAHTCLGCLVG